MRQASRRAAAGPQMARVQSYHAGDDGSHRVYALAGYSKKLYFTSDRVIALDDYGYRADGGIKKGYGIEVETVTGINNSAAAAALFDLAIFPAFPAGLWKMQSDGSLGGSGVEIISQCATKEFYRNNYRAFKLMYDEYFKRFGFTAGRDCCGMHTNISAACFGKDEKQQGAAVKKLYYMINRFYYFFFACYKRNSSTTYCDYDQTIYGGAAEAAVKRVQNIDFDSYGINHYTAVDLGHFNSHEPGASRRVEMRIPAGCNDYATFRNTMELTFFLVDRVKQTAAGSAISWKDLKACEALHGELSTFYDNHREYLYLDAARQEALKILFDGCNTYVKKRLKDVFGPGAVEGLNTVEVNFELT